MFWIGLTGGLASGKSTVANILKKKNISVVNADLLAREAVKRGSDGFKKVVSLFGTAILTTDGELDRKKLAEVVFGQKSSLEKLENILHPIIRRLAHDERQILKARGELIAFYDVPLLFEKKMENLFDKIVLVTASEENQIQRAMLRDQTNEIDAKRRMSHQMPLNEKMKHADYVVENNAGLKELEQNVEKMLISITSPTNSQRSK